MLVARRPQLAHNVDVGRGTPQVQHRLARNEGAASRYLRVSSAMTVAGQGGAPGGSMIDGDRWRRHFGELGYPDARPLAAGMEGCGVAAGERPRRQGLVRPVRRRPRAARRVPGRPGVCRAAVRSPPVPVDRRRPGRGVVDAGTRAGRRAAGRGDGRPVTGADTGVPRGPLHGARRVVGGGADPGAAGFTGSRGDPAAARRRLDLSRRPRRTRRAATRGQPGRPVGSDPRDRRARSRGDDDAARHRRPAAGAHPRRPVRPEHPRRRPADADGRPGLRLPLHCR